MVSVYSQFLEGNGAAAWRQQNSQGWQSRTGRVHGVLVCHGLSTPAVYVHLSPRSLRIFEVDEFSPQMNT